MEQKAISALRTASLILLTSFFMACQPPAETVSEATDEALTALSTAELVGDWRAVLTSPGGELPFTLRLSESDGGLHAVAVTDTEEAPFSGVEVEGQQVILRFSWYDSEITAEVEGPMMKGEWRRTSPEGTESRLPFVAMRGEPMRFMPASDLAIENGDGTAVSAVAGNWSVTFRDEDGEEPARGEFRQEGEKVTGTFLTPTGDYRFLEGTYESGVLRLSTFDGAHAFLFQAKAQADGTLSGDFWSRDTYHATWTAERLEGEVEILPDAWELAGLTNVEGRFSFSFPDLEGNEVSFPSERFEGKVVMVNIFGSWCPNCNDEAPHLAEWYQRYRDQGLEIIGLAYEFSGDLERDREMVRRFAKRYGLEYPLLVAGVSDKAKAAATLPDLTAVIAYPTTIFIDRQGKVQKIHSGFSGPGTGEHYEKLLTELEGTIEGLLAS